MKSLLFLYLILTIGFSFSQDGTIDLSFQNIITNRSISTNAFRRIYDLDLQSDGKIIVVGDFDSINGNFAPKIARLLNDGTFDPSFNPGQGVTSPLGISKVKVLQDNSIFISGSFSTFNGVSISNNFIKLSPDGGIDPNFSLGLFSYYTVKDFEVISDDVIAAVRNDNNTVTLKKFDLSGVIDNSFNVNNWVVGGINNSSIYDIYIQNDNKILIAGYFSNLHSASLGSTVNRNYIARFHEDGNLDLTFNSDYNITSDFYFGASVCELNNNSILLGGDIFSTYFNDTIVGSFVELGQNGAINYTSTQNHYTNGRVWEIHKQFDGKYLLGGSFETINGEARYYLSRFLQNGELDNNFQPNFTNMFGVTNSEIYEIRSQQDGKLFLLGDFSQYDGQERNGIVRINNTSNTNNFGESDIEKLQIIENPLKDYINIKGNNLDLKYLFTMDGRPILESKENKIDVRKLSSGSYILKVGSSSQKVIINH